MIGRTAKGDARRSSARTCAEALHQDRLANTGFPADEDDLPEPGLALTPATASQPLPPRALPARDRARHKLLVGLGVAINHAHADRHGSLQPLEGCGPPSSTANVPRTSGRRGADHRRCRREAFEPRGDLGVSPSARCSMPPPPPLPRPRPGRCGYRAARRVSPWTVPSGGHSGGDGLDNAQAAYTARRDHLHGPWGSQNRPAGHRRDIGRYGPRTAGRPCCGFLVGAHHRTQVFRVKFAESCVEPTRSQSNTVSCRRSASDTAFARPNPRRPLQGPRPRPLIACSLWPRRWCGRERYSTAVAGLASP